MRLVIDILKTIIRRFFRLDKTYISKAKNSNRWVYISYIPEVFYNTWNIHYMEGHQSRKEMIKIVQIFNELGFNVYVSNFLSYTLPDLNVELVFGVEPGFIEACKKYKKATKIYYATGAYFDHQNRMIKQRTDLFNKNKGTSYPYERMVNVFDHFDYADFILQIGSKFTVETYPNKYKNIITTIHQSTTLNIDKYFDIQFALDNEYVWIGGGGSILKGLDLVLDYFIQNPNKQIHLVGTINNDFLSIYKEKIGDNIHIHGFMNMNSNEFKAIINKCNYLIYPSCTEGGCPGAVINAMYYGLIPIVTPWAAFDEIEEYGILLNELSSNEIGLALEKAESISETECIQKKINCHNYVRKTYNLCQFSLEFEQYMKRVI